MKMQDLASAFKFKRSAKVAMGADMHMGSRILGILKVHKGELASQFGIRRIGLFGSYARGEQGKASDVDILVDFEDAPNLFEFVELKDRLSALIGKDVDLVPKSGLKPRIGQRIMKEVVFA